MNNRDRCRKHVRLTVTVQQHLRPERRICWACGGPLRFAYQSTRQVQTLTGELRLVVEVYRCPAPDCASQQRPYHPEADGGFALPHGEIGLDVIALVGALRYHDHQSVPEIHAARRDRGVVVAERTVTTLLARYEELLALHLTDPETLRARFAGQAHVVLAIDGLRPDVGHEVRWVVRDVISGQVLAARSLLSSSVAELTGLVQEAAALAPVSVIGVVSDAQHEIGLAVAAALPGVPHQLCQFHYLKQAALPIFEADRHAKHTLRQKVRGIRSLEHEVEDEDTDEARAIHGYCQAVRASITDDGRPPLSAPGLRLWHRLTAIHTSIAGVAQKRGACHQSSTPSTRSSRVRWT